MKYIENLLYWVAQNEEDYLLLLSKSHVHFYNKTRKHDKVRVAPKTSDKANCFQLQIMFHDALNRRLDVPVSREIFRGDLIVPG